MVRNGLEFCEHPGILFLGELRAEIGAAFVVLAMPLRGLMYRRDMPDRIRRHEGAPASPAG